MFVIVFQKVDATTTAATSAAAPAPPLIYISCPLQGGLDPTKGDFDWSEIDQSRSVGAETSYVPFFTPHHAWFPCASLIRPITRAPAEKNEFPNFVVTEERKKAW